MGNWRLRVSHNETDRSAEMKPLPPKSLLTLLTPCFYIHVFCFEWMVSLLYTFIGGMPNYRVNRVSGV